MITFSAINAGQSARLAAQQNAMRFGAQLVNPGRVVVDDEDPPRHARQDSDVVSHYILPIIKRLEPKLAALVGDSSLPGTVKPYPYIVQSAMGDTLVGFGIKGEAPHKEPVIVQGHYDERFPLDEARLETDDTVLQSFDKLIKRYKIIQGGGNDPMHPTEFGDL